jgi:hypothetical protein
MEAANVRIITIAALSWVLGLAVACCIEQITFQQMIHGILLLPALALIYAKAKMVNKLRQTDRESNRNADD